MSTDRSATSRSVGGNRISNPWHRSHVRQVHPRTHFELRIVGAHQDHLVGRRGGHRVGDAMWMFGEVWSGDQCW